MFLTLYTFFSYLILPLYFFRLLIRGIRDNNQLKRWKERIAIPNLKQLDDRVLWIHAVSVGEVNAAIPLVKILLQEFPDLGILVTTSTLTGSDILLSKLKTKVHHQYLPLDLPYVINRFLKFWQPRLLILLETEIWPNFIHICNKKNIPSVLANARLSEQSLRRYKYIKPLISNSLEKLDLILPQYETDAFRFKELSPLHKGIKVCGNLKFDYEVLDELKVIAKAIRDDWAIEGVLRPTLIAASTHEGEEEIILDAFKNILESINNALLIIVPRHPERFDKVLKKILSRNLKVARRSLQQDVSAKTEVILGDTMGELILLYLVSDIAFVGGSLIDHGGQNLLEPASLSKAICSGPSLRNFEEVSLQLKNNNALRIVSNSQEIEDYFIQLMDDEVLRINSGEFAFEVFKKNQGATVNILSELKPYLMH